MTDQQQQNRPTQQHPTDQPAEAPETPPNGGGRSPARTVRGAVAKRTELPVAVSTARGYLDAFSKVLPSHIEAPSFIGAAEAALRRDPDLLAAANNNPQAFIVAMMQSATLGHIPGSKEFYLTVRGVKQGNGRYRDEIAGMEGYRGVIERMYRSGAVAAVKVREVCAHDEFAFVEGEQEKPVHTVDWFADVERHTPEAIIGVYAYAELTTGATSRVVILNRGDLARAQAHSDLGKKQKGPWVTDFRAMCWKTAAHRLEPWVPTSSEYRRVMLASAAAANTVAEERGLPSPVEATGEPVVPDDDSMTVDAELVD